MQKNVFRELCIMNITWTYTLDYDFVMGTHVVNLDYIFIKKLPDIRNTAKYIIFGVVRLIC